MVDVTMQSDQEHLLIFPLNSEEPINLTYSQPQHGIEKP